MSSEPEIVILAIDTSTEHAGVALVRGTEPLAEIVWTGRASHSRFLTANVKHVLELGGVEAGDVGAIVVASGPGSFNGLRVGISFGKGMAMSLHVPLAGISTLDVIAAQAAGAGKVVWALMPAGREELYRGRYRVGADGTPANEGYDRVDINRIAREYEDHILLAGPGSAQALERLRKLVEPNGIRSNLEPFTRPVYLAELGRRYLADGGENQVDTLEPLYLRVSSAEERRGGQT